MKEPVWISVAECHVLHAIMLDRFGGLEGVRDQGLLESALQKPQNQFSSGDQSYFSLAASYASGLIKNHPYIDGNKRIGFMVAALFLEANGFLFQAPEVEVVERTFGLAASAVSEADYAIWLENSCARR